MIVKMKKLGLLCVASEKDVTLEALRRVGVLHVTAVTPPEGKELEAARGRVARIERALGALTLLAKAGEKQEPAPEADPEQVVEKVSALLERRKDAAGELERIRMQRTKIEPLGDFDPASAAKLAENGIGLRVYRAAVKQAPVAPDGAVLQVLSRERSIFYFAVIGMGDGKLETPPGWEPIEIPDVSLKHIEKQLAARESEAAAIEAELAELGMNAGPVEGILKKTRQQQEFLTVSSGMGEAGEIVYLRGFCPERELERVRAAAAEHGWGLLIEDPDENDAVPTLISYPRWVKPVKAVLEMINVLPGYREIDISAAFLVFFSVFFGMIVGDAGYGLIFLVITLLARRKMPRAPAYPFVLFGILSACTIIWGSLTGNYFGISPTPAPLAPLKIGWLGDNTNVMKLCFLIGAIHLTLAHAWNALRMLNSPRAIAQAGWIFMTWTMFLAANYFVCGDTFPAWGAVMGGAGLVAIVLFMTPVKMLKQNFIHHAMLPLTVINNFVDVVSYVRLFAVGMASAQVAQSFNSMAMDMGAGRVWAIPLVALILLFGHGLNILLCGLGVLVHGVRLNTLEFSGHIGLEWAGLKYTPFKKEEDGIQ